MSLAETELRYYAPLGNASGLSRTERGIVLNVGEERFRVEVMRADVLKLEISQAGRFDEQPTFAVAAVPNDKASFEIEDNADSVTLRTSALRLVINKRAFGLAAYRTDGSVIFEDDKDESGASRGYLQLNDCFMVSRSIGQHDPVYGLGQKTGPSNRRGRKLTLWNTDVLAPEVLKQQRVFEADVTLLGKDPKFDPYYTSIPFFYHARIGAEGTAQVAGFFIDNSYKASFDFSDKHRYLFCGGQYTEYVFAGPNVPEILEAYSSLTGRMQPPPLWSLGHHQCRWKDYTQEEFLAIGKQYREKKLPCDSLWLDIGYMDGYRVYTWNKERFSDVPKMMKTAEADGFKVITIVDPGVKFDPGYSVFEEGSAKGVFCKTEAGKLYVGQVWPGRTVFPDFTLEKTRSFWCCNRGKSPAASTCRRAPGTTGTATSRTRARATSALTRRSSAFRCSRAAGRSSLVTPRPCSRPASTRRPSSSCTCSCPTKTENSALSCTKTTAKPRPTKKAPSCARLSLRPARATRCACALR